ncbi:hypothetical protein PoB_007394200 [Plakobranchus ocellatus]|uniref:Uncharacterized protein n=1 Tax=Plakobranchus ocellatus TaxID=259542 RepID=A0AAV4DTT7_9GAST|nr:hypothetical protein PoB_007394200 [Plakobranchus ocellatus]
MSAALRIGGGVSGTVDSESTLRSAAALLSRVRVRSPAPKPAEDLKARDHLVVAWIYTKTKPEKRKLCEENPLDLRCCPLCHSSAGFDRRFFSDLQCYRTKFIVFNTLQ